jgi:twitching motility two-component system response regulator PilG
MVSGMTANRSFSVAMVGLRDFDQRLLSGIFKLSMSRNRSYYQIDLNYQDPPDIIMLGADDELAMARYGSSFLDSEGKPSIPTILLSRNTPENIHFYRLSIPCRAPYVLRVLDEITIKELNFVPELTIGGDTQDDTFDGKVIHQISAEEATERPGGKVLVIDDSPVVRKQIEMQLNLLNVTADTAEDGISALQMIKDNKYRAIFLDVVMPGMDGYKVCRTIKKSPEWREVPVIMLTGKSSPFDRVKGKLAGCNSYLTKPVEREAFEKTVRPYLFQTKLANRKIG